MCRVVFSCWCLLLAHTSVNATCVVVVVLTEQLASGFFLMKMNWSVLFERILHNNQLVHLEPFVLVCSSFVGCTTFHVVLRRCLPLGIRVTSTDEQGRDNLHLAS